MQCLTHHRSSGWVVAFSPITWPQARCLHGQAGLDSYSPAPIRAPTPSRRPIPQTSAMAGALGGGGCQLN
jgi:hypothetical protein